MTVTMSEKHQVVIPKKIAAILHLRKGSLFDVGIQDNHIVLTPLEVKARTFNANEYKKLDKLLSAERGKENLVTKEMITNLKKGKA